MADAPRRRNPAIFKHEMEGFAEADRRTPPPRAPILFTGASTIRMWKTERSFPGWSTLNRGFGGSVVYEAAHFFDRVIAPYAPRAVVFCAGGNDISFGYPVEQVRDDFLALVAKLHAYNPATPLVFLSLTPPRGRWQNAAKVREANRLIAAEIATDERAWFVNVDAPFMGPDGLPMEHLYLVDQVHLNADGYRVWTKHLQPALIEAMRGRAIGEFAGRPDLGPATTCLLFRGKDSRWTAAAWADAPTALPKALSEAKATDLDGRAVAPKELGFQPLFFEMPRIPDAWEAQRRAEMPMPSAVVVWPGGPESEVRVESQKPVTLSFEKKLPGIDLGPTQSTGGACSAAVRCGGGVNPGRYENRLVATGEGWAKNWPVSFIARPELSVVVDACLPGQSGNISLASRSGREVKVSVSVAEGAGALSESSLAVGPEPKVVTFTAAGDFSRPAALTVKTDAGAVIVDAVRPKRLDVPRVDRTALDGRLSSWPAASRLAGPMLASSAATDAAIHLAWSPAGLYLASRLYFPDRETCDPRMFWDWTTMEIFLDTNPANADIKAATVSQFWVCPARGASPGSLRALPGEVGRSAKLQEDVVDDPRIRTAIALDGNFLVMQAFIPSEALGAVPAAGRVWRGALSAQECVNGISDVFVGWPATHERKVSRELSLWGELLFAGTS